MGNHKHQLTINLPVRGVLITFKFQHYVSWLFQWLLPDVCAYCIKNLPETVSSLIDQLDDTPIEWWGLSVQQWVLFKDLSFHWQSASRSCAVCVKCEERSAWEVSGCVWVCGSVCVSMWVCVLRCYVHSTPLSNHN